MAADPTDPDTFEDDEEVTGLEDVEAPEADTVEQRASLLQHRDSPMTSRDPTAEADPADAAEQARVVEVDEDEEYR